MPQELRDLLQDVKKACGGSYNKMGMAFGIGATSVLAYFKDDTLPGFDKIPLLAKWGGKTEEYVRGLLTKAHEERALRRRTIGAQLLFSTPKKDLAKSDGRLYRRAPSVQSRAMAGAA